MIKKLIFAAFLSVSLFSCKKTNTDPQPTPTTTTTTVKTPSDYLTAHTWRFEKKSQKIAGVTTNSTAKACENDDTYTYNSSTMKLVMDYGTNKCSSSETKTVTYSYVLASDGKSINLANLLTYSIDELNDDRLTLKLVDNGAAQNTFIYYYIK